MRPDEPDFGRNAAFYDQVAAHYDGQLGCSPYNHLARSAFQDLVARFVPTGSTLLDFGCGTGIDALHYARQGYRVLAYDNSPGMVAQLEIRCQQEILAGAVTAGAVDYPAFIDNFLEWPAPAAVVSNFAVLNSLRDLAPLFAAFAKRLSPPGWVIVSLLNPLHWGKVKMRGWWQDAWRRPTGPRLFSLQPYATYLHFVTEILRSAEDFHLVGRANAGRFVRYDDAPGRGAMERLHHARRTWWGRSDSVRSAFARLLWQTPAYPFVGHFLFLVLRRDP